MSSPSVTMAGPPGSVTNRATAITGTSATLNGAATGNNGGGPAASACFCFGTVQVVGSTNGTTGGLGGTLIATAPGTASDASATAQSASVGSLLAGSTYFYVLVVDNASGFTDSSVTSFSTATVSTAPTALIMSSTDDSITATWSATGSNGGSSVTGFTCTLLLGFNVPSTYSETTTSDQCVFVGLTSDAPWGISVVANNGVGQSSPIVAFTTTKSLPAPAPRPPAKHHAHHKTTITSVEGQTVHHVTAVHGLSTRLPAQVVTAAIDVER